LNLATWQSVGFVFGIGISSNAFNLTAFLQNEFGIASKINALQLTVFIFALFAALMMFITVLAIDEKKCCTSTPSSVPLMPALKQTLRNRNFLLFIVADFSYFISVTLITSGLMYFVTVLLPLSESIGNKLMITMVLVSFLFYPVTNFAANKTGKKPIVLISLVILALVFFGIFLLGKFSFTPEVQIFSLIALVAVPVASLNILPNAILADVIEKDGRESGQNKEAIYFAVRYFFVKIAQTFGMALFAILLGFGKDAGNDSGIRFSGLAGCVLCLLAALVLTGYRDVKKELP
jgi:GPH family glycoside/pentoside/hexuronide:cation symporter